MSDAVTTTAFGLPGITNARTTVIQANHEIRTTHGFASEAAIASVAAPPAMTAVRIPENSFPGDKAMGTSISSRSSTVTAR